MKIETRRIKRALRVRNKIKHIHGKVRISVFRSLNQIYAQVIDDQAAKTLFSCSSLSMKSEIKDQKQDKTATAKLVGVHLGKQMVAAHLENVYFDRGSYLYHGRVAALADGLREAGVKI